MSRAEFSKATKRAAIKRSNGFCEAWGKMYGLASNVRCAFPLANGVEFDHIILEANSHDNSLDNCAAVCRCCHDHKTRTHDIPLAAKTLRQQDKARGIKRKHNWGKRPMSRARYDNARDINADREEV